MPSIPFFRGPSRIDWLFAVLLQTSCDWGTDEQVREVMGIIGSATVSRHSSPGHVFPDVFVVVSDVYVFVVSASTHPDGQWIGNVLGSPATVVPLSHGTVSAYIGGVAAYQYAAVKGEVVAAIPGRKLVLIGFSLGAASLTVVKDMFARNAGVTCAFVGYGGPRTFTASFIDGFDRSNYSEFGSTLDPVPSLPPRIWSGLGLHNSWIPYGPFVAFDHCTVGNSLTPDGTITSGYELLSVPEVVFSFATGQLVTYHAQSRYARLLRSRDLPESLPDGFEGYAHTSLLDNLCASVFPINAGPWQWASPVPQRIREVTRMSSRLTIHIRDKSSPPVGAREVYFFDTDDPQIPFSKAVDFVGSLKPWISARAKFLSSDAEIYAVGCSHVGTPKKSWLRKLALPLGGATGPMDELGNCIVYFGFSPTHDAKRQFHFRGVDKTWLQSDSITGVGEKKLLLVTTFLDQMKAGGLSIQANNVTIGNGIPIVAGLKAANTDNVTLTLGNNTEFATGVLVVVTGCKAAPLLNGTWLTAGVYPAGQVILGGSFRYAVPAVLNGKIRLIDNRPLAATSFEFNGVGFKRCGRPSFLQRGRQPVKLRHR